MRIIGIDPGTATTGFGIIEKINNEFKLVDFGCIKTSPTLSAVERLEHIAEDFQSIVRETNPQVCAIEKIFFSKNIKTAIKVAEARGVLLQNAKMAQLEVFEYSPSEVKITITSDGQADKKQIQKMVQIILKLNFIPKPDDAADAIAIALCHAQNARMHQSLIKHQ